jgi:glycerol-3-phosphate O-acyltransferase/dihydroxyacetone phosphate acyltransferase
VLSETERKKKEKVFAVMASKEVAATTATDAEPHDAPVEESEPPKKELYPMVNWKYDLFLYGMGNLVNLFFREVVPRGSWRVPQTGPVLFVAAPHANQVWSSSVF